MKKLTIILTIFCTGILASCHCFKPCDSKKKSPDKEIKKVVIKKDSIKTDSIDNILVSVGDTFEIKLIAQFSTGRRWVPTDTIPEILFLERTTEPIDTDKFIYNSWQIMKYKANKTGEYLMKYEYKQPFETNAKPDSIYNVDIIVK